MNPFLKWAGGKRWLIPRIRNNIPTFSTYYEPFLGSGALFFLLEPKAAILADMNPDLINCYRQVKNNCPSIIKILKRIKGDKDTYYLIREKFNTERDRIKKAAYFIYINKTCWNGLYRVNKSGKFNVPIGRSSSENSRVFDADQLLKASRLLKRAKLKCCDFEEAVKDSRRRTDFIYFDPPYITTHINNGFAEYNSVLFQHSDELRLAKLAEKLARRGAKVMVSNAAHPLIKQQYDGVFFKTEIERPSLIAGDPNKRSRFTELLVTSFPINLESQGSAGNRPKHSSARESQYRPSFNPKCKR
ncbi:MAG: Dam family site-specific DNA-(adenine-N6)-methyltransferase [Candidatus Omnitrophica bacterium]|nr:Dam family site-specific DNA-(adenine-N6)-methyltransferase [Candidatus Omnitrophota bacterium]